MKTLVFFLLLFFSFQVCFSQKVEVGGDIGYANSPFSSSGFIANGFQLSALTNFYPNHAIFYFNTGLAYQKEDNWNFIKIPLGLVLSPGRKVKFLIGLGLYANFVILQSKFYSKYDVIAKNDVVLDAYFLLGSSFNFEKNWSIFIKSQVETGLTTLYIPTAEPESENHNKFLSVSVSIGVAYLLFQK